MARISEDDLIPGTEVLFTPDENGALTQTSDTGLHLVPEPSNAIDDPLNWSRTWKLAIIVNQAVFVFVSIMTPLSIAPLTEIFIQEFDKTLPEVNMLFGAAAITLGYANFIIVPCANVFGRRPTLIVCGLVCVLANVWQGLVKSYPSFIGARVVSGLGAAANESIMPMVIADLMFLHQRGLWMGVYFWAYFIGLFLGPIISGNIAAHMDWRWFFWVCTILQGASLIVTLFLLPETRFNRDAKEISGSSGSSTHGSQTAVEKGLENSAKTATGAEDQVKTADPPLYQNLNRGRPSKEQFSLVPQPRFSHGLGMVIRDIISPLQIFGFPIVLWASLSMGFAANCLLGLNLTQAQVFAPPPYNFTSAQIGFVNFAFVVGAVIGLLTAGPVSDWVSMRRTRANGGIREAEMRLVALIPYIAICLVGMTITAVGYQRQWPWQPIVIVGYGFVGIEVVAIPAIVISYAVDSYKHLPGEIMISATIVKNTFGFGMIFFFNDWATRQGFIPPVMTLMALCVGFSAIGLVIFMIWGKEFRRWTKDSKLHLI